jgi:uncharacterized protein (DUF2384 family)
MVRPTRRTVSDTFETREDAVLWLRKPHPLLDGKPPLQVGRTYEGAQRVKSILIAIKYGGAV